jgi:hypothetical protein
LALPGKIVLNPREAHVWTDLGEYLQAAANVGSWPVVLAGLLLSAILALLFFAPCAPYTEEACWASGADTEDLFLLDV